MFTSTPLAGNGLAVVHDADDLDAATMLAFARETRLSETTFVQASQAPEADYRNRIFTMMGELDFAGHPSLGTAVAVARSRGEHKASYVQQTPAGLQPIDVELAGDVARASMLQEPARFGEPLDPVEVLAAVGLDFADAHPQLPCQPVSTGLYHVMVPVADAGALDRTRADLERLRELTRRTDSVVLYVFHAQSGAVRARGFFESPSGVIEDPATGSAAGPLCAYLARHTGTEAVTIEQGVGMGRPSRLEAQIEGDRVRVSGEAVVVFEAELVV